MKYLSFDLRALSLMRICIAAILILDLNLRIYDLEMFYSDTGVVPLHMLFEHLWNKYFISVHTISGLWQVEFVLFMLAYFFAFMLLIGYRTRLFTFLSWFMLLSLHNRNGLILQGGDDLLRMVLFWAMFIPWGTRYSCDNLRDISPLKIHEPIRSEALIAYILQICYIYTGSAFLKGAEWDTDFTALYYTYSLDQIAYPVTQLIYPYSELLKALTCAAYYFELLVPALFFIPFKHDWFRAIGVLLIIIFHAINGMTLLIGLFPIIGMATAIGILPSFAMDRFDRILKYFKRDAVNALLNFSFYLENFIPWQKPVYIFSATQQNIQTALVIFLTVFVFDWNFSNLSFINSKLSDNMRFIGYGLRLDQHWGMFAPSVFKNDGWYIFEGITEQNEHIDIANPERGLTFERPKHLVYTYNNDRWRKYSENCIFDNNAYARGYLCNYKKRIWNEVHPDKKIKTLRVIYMEEFSLPDYQYSPPVKKLLWECRQTSAN